MNHIFESRILIVDDNQQLLRLVADILAREGFLSLHTASSCLEAKNAFNAIRPDLVILDIMLPDGDGFSLMRSLRETSDTPVLFLSARDEDNDRLLGLGLGADDYMTKPFLPKELSLRVCAILKRTYFPPGHSPEPEGREPLRLGGRTVNFSNAEVYWQDGSASLTAKELAILKKLEENRGRIVTFDALCLAVWGDSYYGYENTLMVHIRRLREKIEDTPSSPRWLLTARGLGYKLAGEEHGQDQG